MMPAAVLWAVVYPLLAREKGARCTLLVPENDGVCQYLKAVGLFRILQQGDISADDRDIRPGYPGRIPLPLTKLDTEEEAAELANRGLDALSELRLGAANLRPLVSEVLAELALNAVQHSESPIGAYGVIQYYESQRGPRFICGVADGGIGIKRSLEKNPELLPRVPYDWSAIELAVRERVTSTGDATRGIGLFDIAEETRRARRQLLIHSGKGWLQISEDAESQARRTKLFPGTLAYASIPA